MITLPGVGVRSVSIEGLLKTKQSERKKDRLDRHALDCAIAAARRQEGDSEQ